MLDVGDTPPCTSQLSNSGQIYRKYWAMNAARLSKQFDIEYFALLDKCRKGRKIDVHEAATELTRLTSGLSEILCSEPVH
jgi:hypothetical protein